MQQRNAPRNTLIISDLDSVLCQTIPATLRVVFDRYGVVMPPRMITIYDMEHAVSEHLQRAGIERSAAEIDQELREACWDSESFFRQLAPRVEIWAALFGWQRAGGALQFVTRRQGFLRRATTRWLKDHGLLLTDPGPLPQRSALELDAPKAEIAREACERFERVIVLEDAVHHVGEIAEQSDAEIWVTVQPWNDVPLPQRCQRLPDDTIGSRLEAILY